MKTLILASQSPRRAQLLEQVHLDFKIQSVPTEEQYPEDMAVESVPEYVASGKALALWYSLSEKEKTKSVVLACDTVVALDDEIIGKPSDLKQAEHFLNDLSGRMHEVISGVCILGENGMQNFSSITKVYFKELKQHQIDFYLKNYKVLDKAGAYAIQEWIGLVGIDKIEGDFYNVMGLPISMVLKKLEQHYPESLNFVNK